MKFIRAFLRCLLGFTLAFLLMFFVIYKEYMNYKNIPSITMNVGSGNSENNKLPTLETLSLSFPGYSENEQYYIFDCHQLNNLTVKITAINPMDEDGMVSKLVFYYFNADDPTRILEYKETLVINPYAYFVIPRIAGEYKFGVIVYDNNGGIIDSEEYLGSNPSIYFPSCDDAPTVTLRLSTTNVEVGDTVKYTVIARTALKNEDFENNKKFYYDFTGDGVWDLITGSNIVEYTFTEGYSYGVRPRVAVEYKGKLGISDGANIYVGAYDGF